MLWTFHRQHTFSVLLSDIALKIRNLRVRKPWQWSISEMMTKKSYSPQTQAKIAKVFGYYDLLDFFALGRKLLEGNHKPDSFIIQVGKSGPGGADRTLQSGSAL